MGSFPRSGLPVNNMTEKTIEGVRDLGTKGRITLPESCRNASSFVVKKEGNTVILEPQPKELTDFQE